MRRRLEARQRRSCLQSIQAARRPGPGQGKRPGKKTDDDDAAVGEAPLLTHLLKWVRGAILCPLAPRYHAVSRHEPPPEMSHSQSRYS